jgi:hypothetical protein
VHLEATEGTRRSTTVQDELGNHKGLFGPA